MSVFVRTKCLTLGRTMNICQIETFPLWAITCYQLITKISHNQLHIYADSQWHLQNLEAYSPAIPEALMAPEDNSATSHARLAQAPAWLLARWRHSTHVGLGWTVVFYHTSYLKEYLKQKWGVMRLIAVLSLLPGNEKGATNQRSLPLGGIQWLSRSEGSHCCTDDTHK